MRQFTQCAEKKVNLIHGHCDMQLWLLHGLRRVLLRFVILV
jgi:hypothetical protein